MTTALEENEGSASRPGRSLPPGKTQCPLYRRLGGPQGRSGQVRNISPPPGFDPRTAQPVARRYTDYATRPTICVLLSPISRKLNIYFAGLQGLEFYKILLTKGVWLEELLPRNIWILSSLSACFNWLVCTVSVLMLMITYLFIYLLNEAESFLRS